MASITRAIVLQRLEMKKTNEIMRTAAPRREPVRVKLERVNAGFSKTHPPDGQGEIWWARLKEALGTSSSDFVDASLFQLQMAAQLPCSGISELAMNAALAMIEAAAPQNEIEGALAVQMACVHTAAISVLARFGGAGPSERRVAALASAASRLVRAYSGHAETLRRLRHGSDQYVRVEHVHVNEGGQTVIGNIHTQSGKRAQLVGNQAMGDDPDEEGALTHSRPIGGACFFKMSLFRTLVVALLLGLAAYAVMAFANLWPLDRQCDWQLPKVLSCLLGARENLAGGVIGAAGALMAAFLAWAAIQKQIAVQQRANLIADLTFWQRKYDNAKIAMKGLEEVDDITRRCFAIFDAEKQRGQQRTAPYLAALRIIETAGLLVEQSLPVTGSNLIAFRMAQLLERLRHQHRNLADALVSPIIERALKEIESEMHDLAKEIPSTVQATAQELREATSVLSELKQSSLYPKS